MKAKQALILVDLQNDFLPGGSLAVPGGDQVIPIANRLMKDFQTSIATQDWHPPGHGSFAAHHPGRKVFDTIDLHGLSQTLWPVHCVQNTDGAAFSAELDVRRITRVFPKGIRPEVDSYSGFHDNGHRHSTGMAEWLREHDITHLTVCGLATDYCVKHTVLDGLREGFHVRLHLPGCRGVDLQAGDVEAAIREMREAGAVIDD